MIHIIFYSPKFSGIPAIRETVDECSKNINCTYLFFEYPMDVLDYVYQTTLRKCVIFYDTANLDEALEISERIYDVNPRHRFALICPKYGDDIEQLFKKGVSYYIESVLDKESLKRCVEHFSKFYDDQNGKKLVLKTKKGEESISLADIRYVMSDKRKIIVYLEKTEASYYNKLDDIEEALGKSFLRCHQSYIVNMNKIKLFVEDGLLLDNEDFIPVSRKRYFAAKKDYLSYITDNRLEKM